ncbi:hypothetical protein [Rhizobacter sp. LjRoot28]|jgi:hypothetical protein|uniref:hypothetical protein n=1 Tax=Rhizobacter sp. LjRoot28 TaxID=3342309 RepID=UPI003ED06135
MSSEFTAHERLFEVEEHVEIGETYLATQQARLAEYLARGEDPVQLARMMQVMQDLLDGLRVRRARAAADVLTLRRGEAGSPSSCPSLHSTVQRPARLSNRDGSLS